MIWVGEDLVDRLHHGVRPPPDLRLSNDSVCVLCQRLGRILPIDLARRCHEDLSSIPVGSFDHDLTASHIGRETAQRLFDDEPNTDSCCEVHHEVTIVHQLVDDHFVGNGSLDEPKVGMTSGGIEVAEVSRRKVVENDHFVAVVEDESTGWEPMKPAPPVTKTLSAVMEPSD